MARKPRQQRAKETVKAIVEAGFIAVAESGPGGATTRQIADLAGIGVGSLYEYFSNKEAIYQAMSERLVSDTVAVIQPLVPQLVQMPIRTAVLELLNTFRGLLQKDNERYLKCARHAFTMDFESYLDPIRRVLTELVTQYLLNNPHLAGMRNISVFTYIFINSGIYTLVRHLSEDNPPISFEDLVGGLADMISHYVDQELLIHADAR